MDLPATVAGSAVLDSVGMAGLATASEVADFTKVDSMVAGGFHGGGHR